MKKRKAVTDGSLKGLGELDMSGASVTGDGTLAAGGLQQSRRRLEVKPTYCREDAKFLMFNFVKQAQTLKTENVSLQSLNLAMKKGIESLRYEKADMIQQIQQTQHHECITAQKD